MGDTQNSQKDIFAKIQGLTAFLDTTEQKRDRENLKEWQNTFEALRDITNNPLPFLLELYKNIHGKKTNRKKQSLPKRFRSAKKKDKKGKKGDEEFEDTKKPFLEKYHLNEFTDGWLGELNDIIRQSVMNVIPRVDDILYEEIIKAFNCDLTTLVPVVGDGLNNPIEIEVPEIDLLKHLFNDPSSDVGKYMYEQSNLNSSTYPPGQTPYPVNRFLRDLVYNGGVNIDGVNDNHKTIYGKSGKPLFDIILVSTPPAVPRFAIYPYYKVDSGNPNYQSAPNPAPASPSTTGQQKFTFIEWLKDYFENTRIIEFQNLIGALLEVLTGFMSVRNKSFSIQDMKAMEWFTSFMTNILEACDGDELIGPDTESVSHQEELFDSDNFFNFTVEDQRAQELEVNRKKNNVLTLKSCGSIDIPIDNKLVDEAVDDILSTSVTNEKMKRFNLLLQQLSRHSAKKAGYDLGLGSITLPVEIDFKENLIKKLPQILMYSVLSPKSVLPIVLTGKIMNQNGQLCTSLELFAKIFKRVLIRVIKEILKEVLKYILIKVKNAILRMIRQMIKEKLSEQMKKKIRLIRKLLDILLPLINALQNAKNCQEIYNILLGILAANMPDIPFGVPPFLLAAAKMRPGTSALGTFERHINKLQALGVDTGDMPDGTPNIGLLVDLARFQAREEEINDNGKTETVIMNGQVITPVGPGTIVPFTKATGSGSM
jgi:hypothetical protein